MRFKLQAFNQGVWESIQDYRTERLAIQGLTLHSQANPGIQYRVVIWGSERIITL